MIRGFQLSQAIAVAATLGIPDLLAGTARTSDELADSTGTHPATLYRLLRALAAAGILHEGENRTFATTALGDGLTAAGADFALLVGRGYFWEAWGHLLDSVRTGENAFRLLHGESVWEYRAERPEESAIFDRVMTANTERVHGAILDAYDFGRFGVVVDVGGGRGALLRAILDRHPQLEGLLFDQPHVVSGAPAHDRLRSVGGSFFDRVPEGGDAYLLKWIVHDWEDAEAIEILRVVRRAVPADGALLVVELDLGPPNEAPLPKLADLNMLVMPGGRERTVDEYERLLEAAGFALAGVTPVAGGYQILEGAPRD